MALSNNEEVLGFSACKTILSELGIDKNNELANYMVQILTKNKTINLTGARSASEFAIKHIADVVLAEKTLNQDITFNCANFSVDVGSGGGLPGIPLALLNAARRVVLVERRGKKARALTEIIENLGIRDRVQVVDRTFEEIWERFPRAADFWFRGFLPTGKLAQFLSANIPAEKLGRIILMKGPAWPEEKRQVETATRVSDGWRKRFAKCVEKPYLLPKKAGSRILVTL